MPTGPQCPSIFIALKNISFEKMQSETCWDICVPSYWYGKLAAILNSVVWSLALDSVVSCRAWWQHRVKGMSYKRQYFTFCYKHELLNFFFCFMDMLQTFSDVFAEIFFNMSNVIVLNVSGTVRSRQWFVRCKFFLGQYDSCQQIWSHIGLNRWLTVFSVHRQ